MAIAKSVYIIHDADVNQHLGSIKDILDRLKSENRIDRYNAIESGAVVKDFYSAIGTEDMVITMLTNEIEANNKLAFIRELLLRLKETKPNIRIVEIIVDNIPYEQSFIAFPLNFQPIRSVVNINEVWERIENTLKDMFPVRARSWKKWVAFILGALVTIFIIKLLWNPNPTDRLKLEVVVEAPEITKKPGDGSIYNHSGPCPHSFEFNSNIKVNSPGQVVYTWLRSDKVTSPEETINFTKADSIAVKFNWNIGDEGNTYTDYWVQLKVTSPYELTSASTAFNLKCLSEIERRINYNTVRVEPTTQGTYKVYDGESLTEEKELIFSTRALAQKAVDIVKFYRLTSYCLSSKGGSRIGYFKVVDNLPKGSFTDEKCEGINNPQNVSFKLINNKYQIFDGNNKPLLRAYYPEEAERIVNYIKFYEPNYLCMVVGGSNEIGVMRYLRK